MYDGVRLDLPSSLPITDLETLETLAAGERNVRHPKSKTSGQIQDTFVQSHALAFMNRQCPGRHKRDLDP
jgi:hypothetical protein